MAMKAGGGNTEAKSKRGGTKQAAPKDRSWTKNHPLEGDGLLVNFYNHMWKKNKDFQSCPGVQCPDTIVYDHNFPRGWYTYDQKNKELKKKQGKELDTASICTAFSRVSDPNVDIVASYLYSYESEVGEPVTSVEFFTKDDLGDFLNNRKTKKEGILQKFLIPKGLNSSLIQAVWSPRVCIVQRKTNRHAINDKSYSPYERAVTYEGPSHYTDDGICAPKTTAQIKSICTNICVHFQNTEHKNITRMVLYFKVDKNDQVWLLWCGSIRISDRQHQSQMPLNLSPIFTSPDQLKLNKEGDSEDSSNPNKFQKMLHSVDKHQFKLSGDRVFQMTHCNPHPSGSGNRSSPTHAPGSPHSGGGSPTKSQGFKQFDDEQARLEKEKEERDKKSKSKDAPLEEAPAKVEWYKHDHHIHEQYKQVKEEQELVTQILDDVFYEAYSHFLRHDCGAFFFSLPIQLKQILGEDAVDELLSFLKIQPVPETEVGKGGTAALNLDLGLDFWIPPGHHQPTSKLSSECRAWIKQFYDKLEAELKRQSNISLGALGEDDVLNSYNIHKLNESKDTNNFSGTNNNSASVAYTSGASMSMSASGLGASKDDDDNK
eukprot:TRINITY_DN46148_c0_g1_i1.p1 TRINITY_DN46148_c0_g1~~TRINITY_DN46148_c0_g1_i1.p1  ORF type:complete len:610 (-),score=67.34 TRINITY_DN46148_c0_g1_i1:1194-2990(-)